MEPLKVECQHFVNCVKGKERPISGGMEGLQIVQILEAANESIKKNGRAIPISGNKFMQMKNVA